MAESRMWGLPSHDSCIEVRSLLDKASRANEIDPNLFQRLDQFETLRLREEQYRYWCRNFLGTTAAPTTSTVERTTTITSATCTYGPFEAPSTEAVTEDQITITTEAEQTTSPFTPVTVVFNENRALAPFGLNEQAQFIAVLATSTTMLVLALCLGLWGYLSSRNRSIAHPAVNYYITRRDSDDSTHIHGDMDESYF